MRAPVAQTVTRPAYMIWMQRNRLFLGGTTMGSVSVGSGTLAMDAGGCLLRHIAAAALLEILRVVQTNR